MALAAVALALHAGDAAAGRPTLLVNGGSELEKARAAWSASDFDEAERAYESAITHGGLGRTDVLESYAHLGAARFITGKRDPALAAFKVAASIDPSFVVPSEAGKRADKLAETARKQAPVLKFDASAPSHVDSGSAFAVTVVFEPAQIALISRVGLLVRDGSSARVYRFEERPQPLVRFRVPATMTLPGADLQVRVDALDEHDNQLALSGVRVAVSGTPVAPGEAASDRRGDDAPSSTGGFWRSPWPWIIGGALVAGGGVGAYVALRPPSDVFVSTPRIQAN